MPGNETVIKSPRAFLPTSWFAVNLTAGETTGVEMSMTGLPFTAIPLPSQCSLVAVGIVLSAPVTVGLIRFELTKNGVGTGKTVDVNSTTGVKRIWEFKPGELVGDKGDEIGVKWGSSGSLLPSGSIDAVVFLEVQDA